MNGPRAFATKAPISGSWPWLLRSPYRKFSKSTNIATSFGMVLDTTGRSVRVSKTCVYSRWRVKLAGRLANRVQISTDGYNRYLPAIEGVRLGALYGTVSHERNRPEVRL